MRLFSRFQRSTLLALTLVGACLLSAPAVQAADMRDHAASLKGVPQDAAFYAAWLKNAEQIEAVANSNAWKKFINIPLVQMGWYQAQSQWNYPDNDQVIEFKDWFESESGQDIYHLVLEMLSDEVFVYGDKSLASVLDVTMQINSEISRTQFQALRNFGTDDPIDMQETMREKLKAILDKYGDDLEVPTMVMGFRIQDKERAVRLLDLAETELRKLLEDANAPDWVAEQLERRQVAGHDLLVLTVPGKLLPWGEMEEEMEDTPEVFEKLHDLLYDQEIVISLGVVDNFVVMSVSDSLELYEELGQGDLLVDSPEFEKLNQHADQKVVTIGYVSEYFMQALASQELSFGDMEVMASGLISMAGVDEERMEAIDKDLSEAFECILDFLPEPGAVAGVSFLTDRGMESYTYNWGEMPPTVDPKPLTLVDHVGADSLGWVISSTKQVPGAYETCIDYCVRGFKHFEAIAEEKASINDWEEYTAVRDQVLPLLKQLDDANRDCLIPGFGNGQSALVLDASIATDQWCDFMSPADNELALPTLALVSTVEDSNLVMKGMLVYLEVLQKGIDKAHEANPDEVPDVQIPMPAASGTSTGTIFAYNQLQDLGASELVAPNAGINDSTLVLSMLPKLTEKLLDGSRPELDGPVATFDRPLASASHFNIAKSIDVLKPWIDYGIQMAVEQAEVEERGNITMVVGMAKPMVDQMLDALKVFDNVTTVTYKEDDTWVTHGELRIIDLED